MSVDVKRLLDLTVSAAGLLVLSPVLAVIAVLVRLESRGPSLFRQERVGLNGQHFTIHKFRTLRVGAAGLLISPTHDPRITRLGAILRRTKLDELPQLWDVLIGNMSLVGPRPEVPGYVAQWPEGTAEVILSVRPGITDPASVVLRHEAQELAAVADPERHYVDVLLPQKAAMYVAYVQNRSLVGDLRILADTLVSVAR